MGKNASFRVFSINSTVPDLTPHRGALRLICKRQAIPAQSSWRRTFPYHDLSSIIMHLICTRTFDLRGLAMPTQLIDQSETTHDPSVLEQQRSLPETPPFRVLQEVDGLLETIGATWHRRSPIGFGRRWHRLPFAGQMLVTPLNGDIVDGASFPVTGNDISVGGISMVHDRPLTHRHVAITFTLADGSQESILTELKWCRFRRDGIYCSGGAFLRVIDLDLQESPKP